MYQNQRQAPETLRSYAPPGGQQYTVDQEQQQYRQHIIRSAKRERDNIYVNVTMNGLETTYVVNGGITRTDNESTKFANYNVTKDESILDVSSDYYCSVVRFAIPLNTVPIFIMPIIPNQGNANLSPYIIGIKGLAGAHFSQNVEYIPSTTLNPTPVQNQTKQVITPYYYVYNYQELITMVNAALLAQYIAAGYGSIANTVPPHFEIDYVTQLISLIVPSFFVTLVGSPLAYIPQIYMNVPLQSKLDNFTFENYSPNAVNGDDIYFKFAQFNLNGVTYFNQNDKNFYYPAGITIPAVGAAQTLPLYYKYSQEYPNVQYWSDMRKILLTTNMPINNEYLPSLDSNNPGENSSFPILTDFLPNVGETLGSNKSLAVYIPSSQYRLIDLTSNGPLRNIDIRIYWQDVAGNFYPITISIYQQVSVKLAFFRKTLYNNNIRELN